MYKKHHLECGQKYLSIETFPNLSFGILTKKWSCYIYVKKYLLSNTFFLKKFHFWFSVLFFMISKLIECLSYTYDFTFLAALWSHLWKDEMSWHWLLNICNHAHNLNFAEILLLNRVNLFFSDVLILFCKRAKVNGKSTTINNYNFRLFKYE